jgi:hypothetical protein
MSNDNLIMAKISARGNRGNDCFLRHDRNPRGAGASKPSRAIRLVTG